MEFYERFMSACYCDFNHDYFVADLKKVSFLDAWHSNKFMKLREKHLNKSYFGHYMSNCTAYHSNSSN